MRILSKTIEDEENDRNFLLRLQNIHDGWKEPLKFDSIVPKFKMLASDYGLDTKALDKVSKVS